jgi:DNA polymerase-3 subunit epsilon/ATP-dependent DNA helicase DinG
MRIEGVCPFYRAKQAAQNSHLVIVNHALLLADIVSGSRVLPEYDYLIVDEGHHIEAASTGALSYRISQPDLARMLRELGSTSAGVLGRLLNILTGLMRPSELAAAHAAVDDATDLAFHLENDLRAFFRAIDAFLLAQRNDQPVGAYGQSQRIIPATRTLPAWTDVEVAWDSADAAFKTLNALVHKIHLSTAELSDLENDDLEDVLGNLGSLFRRMSEAHSYLMAMITRPDPGYVYWAEVAPVNNRLTLQAAPLHIGPLMEQFLWHEKASVVLTSATLTTQGEFDYLRSRLNADEADELMLGSPFDYEASALLYLCNDIPEPSDASNFQRAVEQALVRLAKATGGRLLALFTSYAQLKRTSQAIAPQLADADITVFEQGEGASSSTLLETFRETGRAVLLGTKAFWEGVDIPGDALSALVIVKLPFDVPTEPIIAARSETFDDPFNEYNLPEAILRFRQGFGRLIRTQSDHGVVAILDRRVLTKRYGRSFIESLPTCKVVTGSMRDLPAQAARWLNL